MKGKAFKTETKGTTATGSHTTVLLSKSRPSSSPLTVHPDLCIEVFVLGVFVESQTTDRQFFNSLLCFEAHHCVPVVLMSDIRTVFTTATRVFARLLRAGAWKCRILNQGSFLPQWEYRGSPVPVDLVKGHRFLKGASVDAPTLNRRPSPP
uniref:Uncharacterized protein n=1 Tax=Rhipicephalus zambeziensis TaxID=60191 RepID=A0A224YCN1_9ACAR